MQKMAALFMHVGRSGRKFIRNLNPGKLFTDQTFISEHNARYLYSDQYLGLDKYKEQRDKVNSQFTGLKEKFFTRMKGYVNQEGQTMVFTEDLKNILYMAEDNPDHVRLCIQMIQKFHKQNKELRFGTYVFGPVVLRWLHFLDKPDLAWEFLTNTELSGLFDQVSSYQLAMDLLFKHKRFEDVLALYDQLIEKNLQGNRYPKEPILLALGACYYLNTPESHQKSISIIQACRQSGETLVRRGLTFAAALALKQGSRESGGILIRRGLTFAAALALKQGDPKIAMEMLSLTPYSNYVTVRNLRLQVLAEMNRLDDIFPILRQVIDRDVPRSTPTYQNICQETLDHIQRKLDEAKDKEMSHIFEQICRALKENDHITEEKIHELLGSPIMAKQMHRGDREWNFQQGSTSRPNRSYNAYRGESHWAQGHQRERTGIRDMDE